MEAASFVNNKLATLADDKSNEHDSSSLTSDLVSKK